MCTLVKTVTVPSFVAAWILFACPLIYGQESQRPPAETEAKKKAKKTGQKPVRGRLPLVDDSVTGYIDNAIVGSRIRLRADAAFGSDFPDRAEFFYAKCGCFRNPALQTVLGASFDPSAPGPGPGDDSLPETDVDYQELRFDIEYAFLDDRFSLFGEIPVRNVEFGVNDVSFSGFSDIRVGFRIAVHRAPGRQLTFQLRGYLPTGESEDGLGTDHVSLEPGLLLYQQLSNRLSLESELRYWAPTSGSSAVGLSGGGNEFSGDIVRYGLGLGYRFESRSGLQVTPVGELVGWSVLGGYKTPGNSADSDTIVNLKLGARFAFSGGASFYFGYGRALTDEVWYEDTVRLEYRVAL